jgi:predicted nucleic acid-binding protein
VFSRSDVEVVTTVTVLDEVTEYLPVMSANYGIGAEMLETQLRLLAIRIYARHEYSSSLEDARRLMEDRDPDDVDLLALALHLEIPGWSNDNDFRNAGIERFTTAELLKKLGI